MISTVQLSSNCLHCGQPLKDISFPLPGRGLIRTTATCQCVLDRVEAERIAQAERERSRRIKALFDASQLGPRFAACTFETWKPVETAERVFQAARGYVDQWPKQKQTGDGLLISGGPGCGKSHLAAAIVNELLSRGAAAVFANVPDVLGRLRRTYGGSGESETRILNALVDADLLVLDDVGAQKWSEWVEETLYYIVNSRYGAKLPIIITTNAEPQDLGDAIGFRTQSRIEETCAMLINKAPNYRRTVARDRVKREEEVEERWEQRTTGMSRSR